MLFQKKTPPNLPNQPTRYPNGSFVKSEAGLFYIAGEAKRFRIVSERVLNSWSPQRVIDSSEKALKNYRIAAKLGFRNGSLIWNLADARLYLIENGNRRPVDNPDALTKINAKVSDAIIVSNDEIKLHKLGDILDS